MFNFRRFGFNKFFKVGFNQFKTGYKYQAYDTNLFETIF